jgi:hypothetical protein
VTPEEYIYIQCGIKKMGTNTYNDNGLKAENTAPRIPSFKTADGVPKLIDSMPDGQALRENYTLSRGYVLELHSPTTNQIMELKHQHKHEMVDAAVSLWQASHLRPAELHSK